MDKKIIALYKYIRSIFINVNARVFKKRFRMVLDLMHPNIVGVRKEGFGREGDGTYVLPVGLIENSPNFKLLSFGISNDISFEKDFCERFSNIDVYAFDPTIDRLPEQNDRINFFKLGLAGRNIPRKKLLKFNDIIEKIGLSKDLKYILKVDIEGWEWEFLSDIDFGAFDIPVIAIELHFFPFPRPLKFRLPHTFYKNKYKTLKKLLASYHIHHIHANNYHYTKFDDFVFPTFLELTLIKKSVFQNDVVADLDRLHTRSNNPKAPDFQYPFIK